MVFTIKFRNETYTFRQGMVYLFGERIKDISEIEGLENLTDLPQLDLHSNQITEIKGLENLRNLNFLSLSSNKIKEIKGLENLTNLTHLNLSHNKITEIKSLENLTKLKSLYLSHNEISQIKGLDNLKDLEILHLNNNKIKILEGLEELSNLRKLYLADNQIKINLLQDLGGFGRDKVMKNAQKVVNYCRSSRYGKGKTKESIYNPQLAKKFKELGQKQLESFQKQTNAFIEIAKEEMTGEPMKTPFSAYSYKENAGKYIFISYAHEDKYEVYPIIENLHKSGVNIWYDEGIPLTSEFRAVIADALANCNSYILFITPTSITRPYVLREINFALNRYDKGEISILPIFLKHTKLTSELEFSLGGIQSILKYKMLDVEFDKLLEDFIKIQLK